MMVRERFSGLFQKYLLVLFMAVAVPLAINGAIEAWLDYCDQRARLDQLLGVEAKSAADEIHDFIDGITNELGWLVQLPGPTTPTSGGGPTRYACFARPLPSSVSHSSTMRAENAFTCHGPASIELKAAPTDPPIPRWSAPARPGSGLAM